MVREYSPGVLFRDSLVIPTDYVCTGSPAATKSVCPTSIPRDISASPRVLNPMSMAPPLWLSSSLHNEAAPPPDPLLLALHATCARVAHKSGAIDF